MSLVSRKLEHTYPQISRWQNLLHSKAQQLFEVTTHDENEIKSMPVEEFLLFQLEEQCHTASLRQAMLGQHVLVKDFNPNRWTAMQHYLPKLKGVLDCVTYMPVTTSPMSEDSACRDSNVRILDRIARYKRAAVLIREPLELLRISEQNDHSGQMAYLQLQILEQVFPASHIALLNGDSHAAFKLWQEAPNTQGIDFLGRSLAHLAVVSGNIDFLKNLSSIPTSLRVQNDFLGLSLQETARILDDNLTLVNLQCLMGTSDDGSRGFEDAIEDLDFTQSYINGLY